MNSFSFTGYGIAHVAHAIYAAYVVEESRGAEAENTQGYAQKTSCGGAC